MWLQAHKLARRVVACLTLLVIWFLPLLGGYVVSLEKGMHLDLKKSQTAAAWE